MLRPPFVGEVGCMGVDDEAWCLSGLGREVRTFGVGRTVDEDESVDCSRVA